MVLQIHSEPEKEMNWSTVSEFVDKKRMSRISPPCSYFIQECKPFGVNWVLAYLWCGIRTQYWSARCWIDNSDAGNMGGNYMSIRESVRVACTEFDKFVSTDMLIEQQQIEKDYSECAAFAKNENPQSQDPVIDPPKPKPLPPLPEPMPPENEPLPKPSTPVKWGKWISIIAPIVLLASNFLPPPFNGIARLVVEILKKLFE